MSKDKEKISIRTCISCREKKEKAAFARIVRSSDGKVLFDPSGRLPGRGAYVCSEACLDEALKTNAFSRSLRMRVDNEDKESLACMVRDHFYSKEAKGVRRIDGRCSST